MKKFMTLALSLFMLFALMVPASAALEMECSKFDSVFDEIPAPYKNAEEIKLGDYWEEGTTNARADLSGNDFQYIFLKQDGLGDFVVPFDVKEEGLYTFAFKLMAIGKSVLRSTNVRIDDGPDAYMGFTYEDEHADREHYFYGISAYLQPGEHTLTFSLASDFDNENVKSLFIDSAYYANQGMPEVPAEPAEPAEDDVPATETPAPATADSMVIAMGIAAAAAAAVVLSKRK